MTRLAALLWLLVVAAGGVYLGARLYDGLHFRTDLLALLPREAQDPAAQRATDAATAALSRQVVLLAGAPDRIQAREAAAGLSRAVIGAGLVDFATADFGADRLKRAGEIFFPYRRGLLTDDDRARLSDGRESEIAMRALSQVYGLVGLGDARLLRNDPFLLLPGFIAALPLPLSRLTLDDGMLSVRDNDMTWIMLAGRLTGDPYALDMQQRLTTTLDGASLGGAQLLRLGAVFFARAGAEQALRETSVLGAASIIGAVLLVLLVFRALSPLWLNLLAVGVGIVMALAVCLLLFGELHVAALLFGVSLIGVAVDYGLQYCAELFAPVASPQERLRRVMAGITIGMAAAVTGYLTFFLAPFPGLHQIAAFAAIGLAASWLTVVLWLPRLDRGRPRQAPALLAAAGGFLHLWQAPRLRTLRFALGAALVAAALLGATRLHADDNVRNMQSLDPALLAQQNRIQALIGGGGTSQFIMVQAPSSEIALQREEMLVSGLRLLQRDGALRSFQAAAQYAPSARRQRENRALVHARLDPLAAAQFQNLNLEGAPIVSDDDGPTLTLAKLADTAGPFGFLSSLVLDDAGGAVHVVLLDGVVQPDLVAAAAASVEGARYVDPAGEFSALLGKYRSRAIVLLVVAAALMAAFLMMRYGWRRGLLVIAPPVLAIVLAPPLRALGGGGFTFFDAMALMLVLTIGVDYAVFLAETTAERRRVTVLAVALAACTTLMSFGILAFSSALAVHSFGATMLVGILLALVLSPMTLSPKVVRA